MMIRQRIKFTEAAFQNIVIYLYVAFLRSGAGHLAAAKPRRAGPGAGHA